MLAAGPVVPPQNSLLTVKSLETLSGATTATFVLASPEARYAELNLLESGRDVVVYRARDLLLNRNVALKVLRSDILQTKPHYRDLLLREAQSHARLCHPNIIPFYDLYESAVS